MKLHNVCFATIIALIILNNSYADNIPLFENDSLYIPTIDSPDLPGIYQEVKFEYGKQSGWSLLDFKIGQLIDIITNEDLTPGINKVEIIQTDSFPIQIFLKITARLKTECEEFGQIRTKLLGETFQIFAYYSNNHSGCASVGGSVPFITKIIPLDVYSLKAGEYKYSVNSNFTGAFSLSEDNNI